MEKGRKIKICPQPWFHNLKKKLCNEENEYTVQNRVKSVHCARNVKLPYNAKCKHSALKVLQ